MVPFETKPIAAAPVATAIVPCRASSGNGPLSLDQLLNRQVAVVRSLVFAMTTTQAGGQPLVSLRIQSLLHEAGTLTQMLQRVIGSYGKVAGDVLARVLPDIALAVQEDAPEMTCQLFDMVDGWVKGMQDDGQAVVRKSEELSGHLQEVLMDAQRQRLLPQIEGGYAGSQQGVQQASTVSFEHLSSSGTSASPTPSSTKGGEMIPKVLSPLSTVEWSALEQLSNFADKAAMSDNPETAICDPKVVDLLLPGLQFGDAPPSAAIVPFADIQPIDLPEQLSGGEALLRAVQELREVSRILKECAQFWANVGDTVHELSRMKDHTKVLVSHASKNARLRERFDMRVSEFSQFWQALQAMADEYCRVVVPTLDYISKKVVQVENTLDARSMASNSNLLPVTVD
jgi:hypothetical protein